MQSKKKMLIIYSKIPTAIHATRFESIAFTTYNNITCDIYLKINTLR